MSRMHMIYDDTLLQQEGVKVSKWKSEWNSSQLQSGRGILLEGVFHKKTRHIIQDTSNKKYRFCVFHIEFDGACQRKFDAEGKEIEPNFGQTAKVKTGYLNSSYKTVAKGTPDTLSYAEVCERVHSDLVGFETASHSQSICFWGENESYDHVECSPGQRIRLKTRGDSLLIESFTKLDSDQRAHSSNYTGGEKTGQSWTDKVLGHKSTDEPSQGTGGGGGGEVDDDEWVRIFLSYVLVHCELHLLLF
ncbi:PREDICTED: arpin-like [Amphimedon queenslandica]|uniref:Arpin n=1 Tax=Amphimedon queenslandica TaxID=400682 RepID=A0A1X7TNX2_AMPQE|nr:PREDICTED: arpin-like [Amphimedon queenslandica]|eukprot:XP_019858664.1 PREDICTED: arpin-like [Amphimedon queenslandica]